MYKNCPLITSGTGFLIVALGAICAWYVFPKLVEHQLHQNIDLVDGTQSYDYWKKQPFPLKFKIIFFNVTNAAEVQNGAKPILKEIGPYVYDQYRERVDISVDETRDVLKYVLKKTFLFNKQDSGCHDIDDTVTILNAALVGTALQVEILFPSALPAISEAIPYLFPGTKDIFLTAKVKDILFDGIRLYCQDDEVEFVCGAMKGTLPKTIKVAENGKDFLFSMFGHLNGTDDGPWEMGRGLKNTTKGQIYSYEGQTKMDIWGNEYCNQINGSDSTVFPPYFNLLKPMRVYTFAQDFCRSLYASYEKEGEEFGIKTLRYSSKISSLDRNPNNRCFCPRGNDEDGNEVVQCPISGLADVTPCMKAPLLISYPHFYLADRSLLDFVTGLDPKKELHENYANIEPLTGTPVSGRKRIQMNMQIKRLEGFELLENVSAGVFPILWIEEGATLPVEFADILVSNMAKISSLDVVKWVLIVSGILLMLLGFLLLMKKEGLLCFGNSATVDITEMPKELRDLGHGYETNPGLYPQLDNRNLNNPFTRKRHNDTWTNNIIM
ncbi:PREDICTED: sensory neuron membrane protein 2-like [Nicrophorus vespilloides]|uniref:Sensory neuron membrane protein 2-like n=1 Tax=Nicrophorus vespilloides TaxID=110193 RepID=A0ABM1MVD2_NICVS|nr:PREDICTED: sensory neuron membrane protein 2-like [Nicrophorus vespilloides]